MPLTFGSSEFFEKQVRRLSLPGHRSQVHVLLHSTNGNDALEPSAVECLEPFAIGDIFWICRLPDFLRDAVYKACEPQGEPSEKSYRQYGQLYTVALFMGPILEGHTASWDGYGHITKFVNYSQLIHPTSIGFGNTAILYFDEDGKFTQASPGPCRGIAEQAFVARDTRNWLSLAECEHLRTLFDAADLGGLPERVARAHWNVQHAAYQYFFEVRTMLVASGLDALVHVRNAGPSVGSKKQFVDRGVQLAHDLGINFTNDDAEALWDHRSDVSHGRDPWQSVRDPDNPKWQAPPLMKDDPLVRRYLTVEEILRNTVLRCLTDPQFAAIFASDDTVNSAYPTVLPPSRKTAQKKRKGGGGNSNSHIAPKPVWKNEFS